MDRLSFEDYKERISIQEVLEDAGYRRYRRDGMLWPCYYKVDNEGRRIRGDKFIVCSNGKACFQPPQKRNYNVISFIAEHTELFPEGAGGKDPYVVVNEVCHRLLNTPMETRHKPAVESAAHKPFNLYSYQCEYWKSDWKGRDNPFIPFFKPRGIGEETMEAFSGNFMLTTPKDRQGARRNLSFPMRIPGSNIIVGLEQRGQPDEHGHCPFKGMAKGTNAAEGVWLGSPAHGRFVSAELDKVKDVYWFESAWDAMAFYQLRVLPLKQQIALRGYDSADYLSEQLSRYDNALYVSTGGSPSLHQLRGVLSNTTAADHHVCFDNDKAGHVFAIDVLLARAGRYFQTMLLDNGQLQVIDQSDKNGKKYTLNLTPFEFDRIAHVMGIGNPDMKDYLESMTDKEDCKSGDYELLPSASLVATCYDRIYALEEQSRNGELYQGIPPEQWDEVRMKYGEVMTELRKTFNDTLQHDVEAYLHGKGSIGIEVPPVGFKDWNDVLMDKRQYDEHDTISAIGEDGDVITAEVSQDHEERVRRDDDEEEDTVKRHSRR